MRSVCPPVPQQSSSTWSASGTEIRSKIQRTRSTSCDARFSAMRCSNNSAWVARLVIAIRPQCPLSKLLRRFVPYIVQGPMSLDLLLAGFLKSRILERSLRRSILPADIAVDARHAGRREDFANCQVNQPAACTQAAKLACYTDIDLALPVRPLLDSYLPNHRPLRLPD